MIIDELSVGVCIGCFFLSLWIVQEAVLIWLDSRRSRPRILIPPGTPTHKFDDIPDDDLLTNREGHPYT